MKNLTLIIDWVIKKACFIKLRLLKDSHWRTMKLILLYGVMDFKS